MSGSIKKIIKKIPFVGSYVKKVQTEKKEEEQKQKLEKKRLELQKEQERIKVWLKSEKQNAPDKNSRKISVIVHHHTGEEQLQKLKENFKEAAAGLEFEVFTADIESKQNTSFAEFCNEAARKATGAYLFFLDESVRLASECLNAMLLAAEQNEKAGAVGARILYPESEKAISKFAAVKSCGIAFHKKKRNKTWYWQPYDLLAGEETLEVDLQPSVQKAVRVDVMLVLRERFLEVRGFDPAYQSIHVKKDEFSETDLCLKLSKAGYQNLLAPAALAFQSAEEKSKPDQAEKDRRLYNLYVYQGKWQSCLTRMFSEEEDKPIVPDSKKIDICAPMPDDENKKFWGDYHYALAMKKELEKHGYQVDVRPYQRWYESTDSAVTIALRGNRPYYPKEEIVQKNIMWNISHPADIPQGEYERFDLVYFASEKLCRKWENELKTKCDVLLQCADPDVMKSTAGEKKYDLLFIGNSRRVYRQIVQDALTLDYPLTIYGRHWEAFEEAQKCVREPYMPNDQVGQAYRDAKIVLNDHWDDMKETGIVSNRLFDALAAEAFIISDEMPEIAEIFEGTVVTYKDCKDLKEKVDYYMEHPKEAEKLAERGHQLVLEKHTFAKRMDKLVQDLSGL